MKTMAQIISEQLMKWPDVMKQPHRFGGIEFRYKGKEIGHLHGNALVDIQCQSRFATNSLPQERLKFTIYIHLPIGYPSI